MFQQQLEKLWCLTLTDTFLCFGSNTLGTATFDPLLIRWSSQESVTDWTPTATNTSGDLRLSQGSEIVCAIRTTRQILVFTENSLHSVQFVVGAPFVFGTAHPWFKC